MEVKPGSRWKSAVCAAEVVVVRPPKSPVALACGGQPMIAFAETKPEGQSPAEGLKDGVAAGKRYFDEESGIEVLGSKAGEGTLTVDGRPMARKDAKALPASD